MPLSTNPTFEIEKLKKQSSKSFQKLEGYTYEEVFIGRSMRRFSTLRSIDAAQIDLRSADDYFQMSCRVKLQTFTQSRNVQEVDVL